MIVVTGWLRMIVVWGSLQRGLLKQLERLPIRSAFSQLNRVGWMSMMRQSDLHERWREMARSNESMRQMQHNEDLRNAITRNCNRDGKELLAEANKTLNSHIEKIMRLVSGLAPSDNFPKPSDAEIAALTKFDCEEDIPTLLCRGQLQVMYLIENDYARFAELLLKYVLIPYWKNDRVGFVEEEESLAVPVHAHRFEKESEEPGYIHLHSGLADLPPMHVRLAEEFVAIRYVSLMRAVLVNIRHLMTFVSFAFVVTIVAWNSYPFRPRQWINVAFSGLLFCLGTGIIWVFAQMYRDALLSRITRTHANELGADFFVRMLTFGALPVLTWLAYQFPSISNTIVKYLEPGLQAVK